MRRKVTEQDLVAGATIYSKYNVALNIIEVRESCDTIHYDNNCYDYISDIVGRYEIEDKPTCIPIFDGDLPQGTKLDSDKVKPSLLLDDMPLAIHEILKVLQFGAKKYSEGNWLKVPNGINRYRNAADRHRLAIDELDDESGLMHLAHEATSVLMLLELKLKEQQNAE